MTLPPSVFGYVIHIDLSAGALYMFSIDAYYLDLDLAARKTSWEEVCAETDSHVLRILR